MTQQRAANPSKGQQSQSSRWRPDAAGGKAFRRFLAHFCHCLFFPLGFKFCCIVLRVANARDLIIDLRRLCYLQWITTQTDSDNCPVIRVRPYNLLYTFVTALKATAWCRVLIAQFGTNFAKQLTIPQVVQQRETSRTSLRTTKVLLQFSRAQAAQPLYGVSLARATGNGCLRPTQTVGRRSC